MHLVAAEIVQSNVARDLPIPPDNVAPERSCDREQESPLLHGSVSTLVMKGRTVCRGAPGLAAAGRSGIWNNLA